jgi:hypothetical protein
MTLNGQESEKKYQRENKIKNKDKKHCLLNNAVHSKLG